jgi:two-component system cell cycle response regulator DivK
LFRCIFPLKEYQWSIRPYTQSIIKCVLVRDPGNIKMPKILLVEDNELNRDMLLRRLERKGYSVISAHDGEQGHSLACSDTPDLILMDISMPLMNGWEVTRLLKSNERTRHIPIIALTAHALVTDRNTALEVGCDDYDTKPVDFARLDKKIENLLTVKK